MYVCILDARVTAHFISLFLCLKPYVAIIISKELSLEKLEINNNSKKRITVTIIRYKKVEKKGRRNNPCITIIISIYNCKKNKKKSDNDCDDDTNYFQYL